MMHAGAVYWDSCGQCTNGKGLVAFYVFSS